MDESGEGLFAVREDLFCSLFQIFLRFVIDQRIAQRRAPIRRTLEHRQVGNVRCDGLNDLYGGGTATLERARELIAHGGMANEEIASCLGFEDGSAFSRAFKRWTGQSPQTLRRDASARRR